MKTTFTKGIWRMIIFLAVVIISCVACEGCEEPLMKAQLEVQVESVADEAATIVASLLPNQPGTKVSWRYKEEGSTYSSPRTLPTQFDGSDTVKVDWQVTNLKANTTYTLEVVASNIAGATVREVSFISGKALAKIGLRQAEDVKLTSAKLTAWFVPNQPETEFTFEYKNENTNWASYTLPTKFSGNDSIKVSFDLPELKENTLYTFRTRAKNLAGEKVSDEATFKTYAAVDADGNYYYAVTIGTQTWLQSNLKTTKFANGDPIPNIQPDDEWVSMTSPAYCYYNNDPKLGEVYGALYNTYVGLDSRGLINGYRVPTIQEYETLINYLGGGAIAAKKLKSATDDWHNGGKGDGSSGFNALPGGFRGNRDTFSSLSYGAVFQTITPLMGGVYYVLMIYYDNYPPISTIGGLIAYQGQSIRLIKVNKR